MIKLSIIIPYYQTYELTCSLLEKLSLQLTDEVEVILIDDGCHEYRLDEFKFVKITHLDKNYGASHAWNVGLSQATGKYIGFIDSDDMITKNYISTLLESIDLDLADEIIFDFWIMPKGVLVKTPRCRAIWKAIYKKWLVPQFDETRKWDTDVPFAKHMRVTEHSKVFLNVPLYYYNSMRENSITWNKHQFFLRKDRKKLNESE